MRQCVREGSLGPMISPNVDRLGTRGQLKRRRGAWVLKWPSLVGALVVGVAFLVVPDHLTVDGRSIYCGSVVSPKNNHLRALNGESCAELHHNFIVGAILVAALGVAITIFALVRRRWPKYQGWQRSRYKRQSNRIEWMRTHPFVRIALAVLLFGGGTALCAVRISTIYHDDHPSFLWCVAGAGIAAPYCLFVLSKFGHRVRNSRALSRNRRYLSLIAALPVLTMGAEALPHSDAMPGNDGFSALCCTGFGVICLALVLGIAGLALRRKSLPSSEPSGSN
jgi:hypothetical protein